jgi:hypothetical protein
LGGSSNSRNILVLRIFVQCFAKPNTGNTSVGLPWNKRPYLAWLLQSSPVPFELDLVLYQTSWNLCSKFFPEPYWTWGGSAPKPPAEPSPNIFQIRFPDLFQTLLRNLIKPGGALLNLTLFHDPIEHHLSLQT